jgi:hypothetical protein
VHLEALTGRYFDRADRSYIVRGYQRCNAVADLQQSLGRASAAINRVVPEQKRCQVYLYLSLVLIMSSEPNGRGHRRIAIQRLDRRIPDKHALADEI